MISKNGVLPNTQKALIKILKALTSLPAQAIYYGSALLAIAATGGVDLPPTLVPLVSVVGGNVLASILERVAKGDQISSEEIRRIVQETIKSSNIESQADHNLLKKQISQMFQQFDLQNYAIQEGENSVLQSLDKGFAQFNFKLQELQDTSNQILDIVKNIEKIVPVSIFQASQLSDQYSAKLINEKINQEVEKLRKSRFFQEFDKQEYSIELANKLIEGVYAKGNNELKSSALAWCVRFLSDSELENAEMYLEIARRLGDNPEIIIAQSFIFSYKKDKTSALSILAKLNTPASRTASLMIVTNCDGQEKAVDWFRAANLKFSDLDADGKHFLLQLQLNLGHWKDAKSYLCEVTDEDLGKTPILNYSVALTYLIHAVPIELRSNIISQLPFDLKNFPLSSNIDGTKACEKAYEYFINASTAAKELEISSSVAIFDEYALWLELKHPEKSKSGMEKLEKKLREPESALRLVPFALQFGIKVDPQIIESRIEQEIALNGEITPNAAIARFALAFTKANPEEIVNYLDQYNHELDKYLDKKFVKTIKIELLLKAGLTDKAQECLVELKQLGLTAEEEGQITVLFDENKGITSTQSIKEQYQKTKSLVDLKSLVDSLENKHDWKAVCEYGQIMFEKTQDVHEAERYVNALAKTNNNIKLVDFIKTNSSFLSQSETLQLHYCLALFYEGQLLESNSVLEKFGSTWNGLNYRTVRINLYITMGNWDLLPEILVNEYKEKGNRNAKELLGSAQLAFNLGLFSQSKEFVIAAAEKGNDDAGVLASAYFLASQGGWEDEPPVIKWLYKAADLSGNNGPIQQMTLTDIVKMKPDWDLRQSGILESLRNATIPMDLCAKTLNRPLIHFTLLPALVNLSENDPRHRIGIPAFSGNRQDSSKASPNTIGIDPSALLTLGFLDIFEKVMNSFNTVFIPHSTLSWLFEEKQKVAFHQPSQISRAHQIRDMLARGNLEKFVSSTIPNSELSAEVGGELASLITEAEKSRNDDSTQHLVVKSSPVYRLTSLMEEEAELSQYSAVLCSCQSIVNKLRQKGQITADKEKKCLAYLQLHEKPWPNQPEITDGAILYLEDVAVIYLYEIGVLDKLKSAGLNPVLSPNFISEANDLISYENYSNKILSTIEMLRSMIKSGIETGKIKISRRHDITEQEIKSKSEYTTLDLFSLVEECEVLICDDRFFNQKAFLEYENKKATIFTTIDILDYLVSHNVISIEEQLELKTQLRRAGYFFVPISDTELNAYLSTSLVINGEIVETLELRAIRENILLARMSNWLQLPYEAYWLDNSIKVYIKVLKDLWKGGPDLSTTKARSTWIVDQLDVRGWAHSFGYENGNNFIKIGANNYFVELLMPPPYADQGVAKEYLNWIDENILIPLKEQSPDIYIWITNWYKNVFKEMVNAKGKSNENNSYMKLALVKATLDYIPPSIRNDLLDNLSFIKEYTLEPETILFIGSADNQFVRSKLFTAVREILSNREEQEVFDKSNRQWILQSTCEETGKQRLLLFRDEQCLPLPDFTVFSPDSSERLHYIEELGKENHLSKYIIDKWRQILINRSLEDDELEIFEKDINDTPVVFARSIRSEFEHGNIQISSLIPNSRSYFTSLVGSYNGSSTIQDYAAKIIKPLFDQNVAWKPYAGFLLNLVASSHSSVTEKINFDPLSSEDIVRAYKYLDAYGDRISQLGAIEVGFNALPLRPEIEPSLENIIKRIHEDVNNELSGFDTLSSLFMFVDGELSRLKIFIDEPPFFRRLASLSQASLIQRQLNNSPINIRNFNKWAFDNRAEQFYVQSLVDMRLEPRWNPDFAVGTHIRYYFLGRILYAAKKYEENIKQTSLFPIIQLIESESQKSISELLSYFLPGPLEGQKPPQNLLPDEIKQEINKQLTQKDIEVSSFIALVNSALIYHIDLNYAELAANALKQGNHRLANVKDKSQLLAIVEGLASVAAVTQSSVLSDELQILVRQYRFNPQFSLSINEEFQICLVTAANCINLNDWVNYVGKWLTELAFYITDFKEAIILNSRLHCLLRIVPELWVSCGRADAALQALISYNNSLNGTSMNY